MIGKTISHYKIKEKLGEGGMGEVYLAEDIRLLRSVALKVLPANLVVDENSRHRFIKEAQTASSLNHPNICVIHDINEVQNTNFIVMEFVDGQTLREMLDTNGAMKENDVLHIAIKICDALSVVHEKGILHRDIKPENIMISNAGYLKVMDFGLAKLATEAAEKISHFKVDERLGTEEQTQNKLYPQEVVLSSLSGFIGTVSYMSPEQALGKVIDQRTDIFSLGIVLYELLTGTRPFRGEFNDVILYQIISEPLIYDITSRQNISPDLEKVIYKCLEKEPDDRYQTISELLNDLQNIKELSETETKQKYTSSSIIKEPERRQMTILFGEISNYDEIIGKTESEQAALIMNDCFERLTSEIEKHGGKTDKIIGGTILNFFGAPGSIEDSHKDAVNAAIAMRNKLNYFNEVINLEIPLEIKIGINTGTVIIEPIDNDSYRVMGDTVSQASQLKDLANKTETLVGSLTYMLTQNDFKYQKLEAVLLKGKEKQTEVYQLISVKEKLHRSRLGKERQIFSAMVGRDKELAKLKLQVAKLLNGVGSIVSVIGEAGIGKSRLIAELKNEYEITKLTFLEGRALSIGKNLSFHPLTDIIKNWAGVTEEDSEQKASQKVENLIREIYPDNFVEIFPFVATMMGFELKGKFAERVKGIKGAALEKLILKNLKEFLTYSALQKPIVLVIEDLHWADKTSIEFLELLYRLAETENILFINVFRPNYKETGERILQTLEKNYPETKSKIHLESLTDNYGSELINNLLKTDMLSSNVVNLISKRSGGNPFFIEEVVRSFIDEGIIEARDNKFYVTKKISSVVIPQTINEVIMARIDRLDEETKSLLKKASVIGRNFFYKIIVEVAENIEDLDDRLAYLKDIQLIKEQKRMDEVEYLFKHALAHETVYDSILLTKRKELHVKTAKAFEKVFADNLSKFYGLLSYHYLNGEDYDKAEEYLIKAGEEALKTAASNEAVEYLQNALNIYLNKYGKNTDPDKKAMLEMNIGIALQNKGKFAESVEYLNKLKIYYDIHIPKSTVIFNMKAFLGFIHFLVGINYPKLKWKKKITEKQFEQQIFWKVYNNSINLFNPKRGFLELLIEWKKWTKYDLTKSELLKLNLLGTAGTFCFAGLPPKLAKKTLDLVNKKFPKQNLQEDLLFNLFSQMYRWVSGNWQIEDKNDYNIKLVEKFMKTGDITFGTLYLNQYILTKIERGEYSKVKNILSKMLEIADAFENEYTKTLYHLACLKLYLKWRKFKEAFEQIESVKIIADKMQDNLTFLDAYSYAARLQIISGNIQEAEKALESASKYNSKDIPPWYKTDYLTSNFNFNIYQLEKSIQNNSEFSKTSKKTIASGKAALKNSKNYVGDRIEIYRLLGTYYWLINKQKKALKWWTKSIEFGENSGGKLELSRTFFEVGKCLSEEKSKYTELNNITPKEYLEKAKMMFEEMDLQWDLEELEKINQQNSKRVYM